MFSVKFLHNGQLSAAGIFAGVLVGACSLLTSAPAYSAEWEVVSLHPPGAVVYESQALAVEGQSQGGWVQPMVGVVWKGSAASASTLPTASSVVWALQGEDKAGTAAYRAAVWVGTHNDYVDLHPAGAVTSGIYGMYGDMMVGEVSWDSSSGHTSGYHAALWHGTADNWQDLSPAGSGDSHLYAIDASGQAGRFRTAFVSPYHAALWHGTVDSVVDLHPAGAYASSAQAVSDGRQGGYVQYARDGTYYPAVWSGTADSFVNFSAPGAPTDAGIIYGMDGNLLVGGARFLDGSGGATIWFGTPESAFNLASLLPSDYTRSEARAVDVDEFGTIRVVGYAYNNNYYLPDGTYYPRNEAMMWVLVPEPSSLVALAAGLAGLAGLRKRR